jgi:hypothetical protein
MDFAFDPEKNELLTRLRGVNFLDVIEAIAKPGILLNFDHPDQNTYPGQKILVVNIDEYAYCVPYVIDGAIWFLKTIYPNRKFRHLIRGGTSNEEI